MVLKVALATTIRPFFRGGSNFRKLEPAKIKISRSNSGKGNTDNILKGT